MITIIFEDDKRDIYYKATAKNFEIAEQELDRIQRNYEKDIEHEEIADDHIMEERYEEEELNEKEDNKKI